MPIDGWTRKEPSEVGEVYESESALVAEWSDGKGNFVALFEDGVLEAEGSMPVDLLPHIQGEWLNHQKAKGIAG